MSAPHARRGCVGALALVVASAVTIAPAARAQEAGATVTRGIAPPGWAIVVEPAGSEPRVLCEPACELTLPRTTALRAGVRRRGAIEWVSDIVLDRDLRLDVRLEDRGDLRGFGHALLVTTGVLLLATAIVGIATEPQAPELGWFGPNHALVFAGIAGGIVLALGAPGVGLSLAFERPIPTFEAVPEG